MYSLAMAMMMTAQINCAMRSAMVTIFSQAAILDEV